MNAFECSVFIQHSRNLQICFPGSITENEPVCTVRSVPPSDSTFFSDIIKLIQNRASERDHLSCICASIAIDRKSTGSPALLITHIAADQIIPGFALSLNPIRCKIKRQILPEREFSLFFDSFYKTNQVFQNIEFSPCSYTERCIQ